LVFGTAPADYQSTPPNFPKQPQFTQWRNVTPFALKRTNQFRPGPPPALTSDRYADDLDEVQSLGIAGSTAATPDEALTGRFWNGAIQIYWNEIAQTASLDGHLTTVQNARLFALLNLSFADGVIAFAEPHFRGRAFPQRPDERSSARSRRRRVRPGSLPDTPPPAGRR
jgi:hypothetical protein